MKALLFHLLIRLVMKNYGYIIDKQGNVKPVSAPTNINGKKMRKHTVTKTGALGASVGFSRTQRP